VVKNFRSADEPGIHLSGAPQSPAEVAWLRAQGVEAVVSLHPVPPAAAAAMRAEGLAHLEFPVEDFSHPLPGQLADLVRFVEEHRAGGVLIHCAGGGGRSATGYAIHLIARGVPVEVAIERAGGIEKEPYRAFLYGFAAGLAAGPGR
jgi:hypothetical protein